VSLEKLLDLIDYREDILIPNASPILIRFSNPFIIPNFPEYCVKLIPAPTHPANQNNPLLNQLKIFYEECYADEKLQTITEMGPIHITLVDFWPLSHDQVNILRIALKNVAQKILNLNVWSISSENLQVAVQSEIALFIRILFQTNPDFFNDFNNLPFYHQSSVVRANLHVSVLRDDRREGRSKGMEAFNHVWEKFPEIGLVKDLFHENGEDWKKFLENVVWDLCLISKNGERMVYKLY